MTPNNQSPFDPFRIDLPWYESRWLVDHEALRLKQRQTQRRNGLKRMLRHRGLVGAAVSVAVAVGFSHFWLTLP